MLVGGFVQALRSLSFASLSGNISLNKSRTMKRSLYIMDFPSPNAFHDGFHLAYLQRPIAIAEVQF